MKKSLFIFGLLFLLLSLIMLSSCDGKDGGEPEPSPAPEAPMAPEGNIPEETIPDTGSLGVEIRELSFRYLTESEYNEGDFSDDLLRESVSFKDGDCCYAVVDLTYHKEKGSVESGDLDVRFEVPSRGVLDLRIEEAATSKITERRDASGVSCSLAFSIPGDANILKTERIVLRLLAVNGGEAELSVHFGKNSSTSLISGKSTQRIVTGESEFSYEIGYNGLFYILKKGNDASAERIEIPEKLKDGIPVEHIYEGAFSGYANLREITIPETITAIGENAFEGCTSLASLVIPSSVTSIGGSAFADCTGLTAIEFLTETVSIGSNAFPEHLMVTYNNGTYMGDIANPYLILIEAIDKGVTEFVVHRDTKILAQAAFFNCSTLTSVSLPAALTVVGMRAFRGCAALTSVTLPDTVSVMGNEAFAYCATLTSIRIPNLVQYIGSDAFAYCAALTEIMIPASVQRIESGAFSGCVKLSSVILPESLQFIGQFAFHACHALTSVTLPKSLSFIGHNAFNACVGLKTVYYGGTVEQWNAFSGREESWSGNSTIAEIVCSDGTITL